MASSVEWNLCMICKQSIANCYGIEVIGECKHQGHARCIRNFIVTMVKKKRKKKLSCMCGENMCKRTLNRLITPDVLILMKCIEKENDEKNDEKNDYYSESNNNFHANNDNKKMNKKINKKIGNIKYSEVKQKIGKKKKKKKDVEKRNI